MFAEGRSAATFAPTAEVEPAFTRGGRRPAVGRGAYGAVTTRAPFIALAELLLGHASRAADRDVDVILTFYALQVAGAPLLAVAWRRAVGGGRGPLETVVAAWARHARRAAEGNRPVTARPTIEPNDTKNP